MDVNIVNDGGEEEVALSPAERISALYLNEHLADIHFVFSEHNGTTSHLPAHKLLLSCASETLEAQLFGPLAEQSEVHIRDDCIDTDTFKLLLKHIYLRHIELNKEQAPKLLYLAKKYLMKSLVDVCRSFVVEQLAEYSDWCLHLLQYLHAALGDSEPTLIQRVLHLIDVNGNAAVSSAQFECLSAQLVSLIVQRDALHVDEVTLFTMVIKWSQRECERGELPVTLDNQRAVLQDILPHIRFPAVTGNEFFNMMRVCRILSANMIADIVAAEDKTVPFNSQPRGRYAHLRRLHIIGGKTVKMYSLDKGCQLTQMQMNEQRHSHSAAYCNATQQLMIIGGNSSGTEMCAEMCTVSDNTPAFTRLPLTQARSYAACICIGKKMFVIGGYTKSCVCYDLTLGTWTDFAPLPYPVAAAGCVVYEDGTKTTILLIGGYNSNTGTLLDTVLQYTPEQNQWIARADLQLPEPLEYSAAVNWKGTLVVIGGNRRASNECYLLNMHDSAKKWVRMPPLKTKTWMHQAVVLGDKIVVMGGRDERGYALKSVEVYDGVQWTHAADLDVPVFAFAALVI